MSVFIDKLRMEATGRSAVPAFHPPMSVKVAEQNDTLSPFILRKQYTISVEYRINVTCLEEEKEYALQNSIKQLERELYGDFIDGMLKLNLALMNQDAQEMRSLVNILMKRVGMG